MSSRAAVGLQLASFALLVAACAASAPQSSSAPSPSPSLAAGPRTLSAGPLAPGTYTTTRFEPTVNFTIGDGWSALFSDDEDEVALERPEAFFGITRPPEVFEPDRVIDTPDDLAAWLAKHPSLESTGPERIRVAGEDAWLVESSPRAGKDVNLFNYPTGAFHLQPDSRARFHVIPMDGPDLVVVAITSDDGFDEAMTLIQPIVDSLAVTE